LTLAISTHNLPTDVPIFFFYCSPVYCSNISAKSPALPAVRLRLTCSVTSTTTAQ